MASENEGVSSPTDDMNLKDDIDGGSGALEDDYAMDICHICEDKMKSPKLLSCLHVFCENCLDKLSGPEDSVKENTNGIFVQCPRCKQKTQLPPQGVISLQSDLVLDDILQKDSEEIKQIGCTSCKAEDKAVARCKTCENLLCPNCVTAHQFMRCFEDHQVVTFEDMIKSGEGIEHLRKPIFCTLHPLESIKFFCSKCLVPACVECVSKVHGQHENDINQVTDAVCKNKETLMKLADECGKKLDSCLTMNSNLNLAFEELEMQKDSSKGLIEETFQSYKAILEEARNASLKELDDLHEKREIGLMESMYKLSNYESRLNQAKIFIERTCGHGHAGQIAQLLQMTFIQLDTLFKGFVMPQVPPNMEFKTDTASFKNAVDHTFGSFSKEKELAVSLPVMGSGTFPGSNMDSAIIQSPNSMELMNLGLSEMAVNIGVSQNMPTSSGLPINVLSGLHSLNIQNQTGHVSGNNSPLSDSGISVDNISHGSGGNTATMFNVTGVTKMQHNQSPLLGSGMAVTGGHHSTSTLSAPMDGKSAILPRDANSRTTSVQNANIEELAHLLNPSQQGVFSNFPGSFDPFPQGDQSVSSPDSLGGEPYPPLSRSKMHPMQISRFQGGGLDDTEIGHWGPTRNKPYEVPLRCKFGSLGPAKGQFNSPHGFCLGVDEDIVVADTNNHRIQVFMKTGEFKYQFGIPGREEGQLWYPRKVAVVRQTGKIIICDRGNERSRMQIFNRNGHFLRRIAIRFIDIVAGLDITPEGHIVAVDSVSPTVFRLTDAGELIKWFDCSDYMREPSDIVIDKGDYYICDFKGHCVVAYSNAGVFLRRIGCESITNYPNGIDISGDGDVLVGDSHGNRFHVGVFQKDGSLVGEFQCPYVKVSRCCGLRLTTEGYIVTLAKNNHHVLVLNTLYIP